MKLRITMPEELEDARRYSEEICALLLWLGQADYQFTNPLLSTAAADGTNNII
jgi:hypothetical protein